MDRLKVVSLTHEEDMDGIGAQAIIYRFFKIPNLSLKQKEIINDLFDTIVSGDIDLVCFRTNYSDYLMQWAAIFAKNVDKISTEFKEKINLKSKRFEDIFQTFYEYLANSKISNYYLKQKIIQNQENYSNIHLIFITDLGFNKNFEPVLNLIENSSLKIAYFDHHDIDSAINNRLKKLCVAFINDGTQTSSEIVANFLLPIDDVALKIAKYGADADFNKYKIPETEKFQSILNRKLTDDVFDAMILFFAKGDFYNQLIDKLYQESLLWQSDQEDYLKTHTYSIDKTTKDDIHISFILGISKLKAERSTRILQKTIYPQNEDIEKSYIFIAIDSLSREVNLRSHKINVYNIAKKFGGGGHSERAGFILGDNYINNLNSIELNPSDLKYKELVDDILEIIEL